MVDGETPKLDDFVTELGLPASMAGRTGVRSDRVEALVEDFRAQLASRRFIMGLLMAFVAMAEEVALRTGKDQVDDLWESFEREEFTRTGTPVNTLNLRVNEDLVRLRPAYNAAEHAFVYLLRRYDYPNMAPHATQAWTQHQGWLESVFAMTPGERRVVVEAIWDAVLELPQHQRRSTEDASPRPFAEILVEFPHTQSREPAGAILQGLAFAYYRADSPNVTIETGKVGAASRTAGRVADVDGWNGAELVLSIEVKDDSLTDPEAPALDSFLANLGEWPDATAIVVCRRTTDEVIAALAEQNVSVFTRATMHDAVMRWDLNKQRLAAREFLYFLVRVQRHGGLIERFETFLRERGITL